VRYASGRGELWDTRGTPHRLADLGVGLMKAGFVFTSGVERLVIQYGTGKLYLLDIAWLRTMGGSPGQLPVEELVRLACEGPLTSGLWTAAEQAALERALDSRKPRSCSFPATPNNAAPPTFGASATPGPGTTSALTGQPTNGISSTSQSVTMPDLTAVPSTQKQPVEEDRPSQLKPPVVKNEPVETMPSGPAEEKLRTVIPTPGSAVGTGEYPAPQGTAVPSGPSEGGPPKDSNDTVKKTVPETKQTLAKPSKPSSVHRKPHRRTEEPTSYGGWKIRK
jgi:hypothetical protein